jgi:hypothetical protein
MDEQHGTFGLDDLGITDLNLVFAHSDNRRLYT